MPFVTVIGDFQITSISPSEVEDNGGAQLTINGAYLDEDAFAFVTVSGVDLPCYSGIRGRGLRGKPTAEGKLVVITPPLPKGGPYNVRVKQQSTTRTLNTVLTSRNRNWHSRVFALRQLMPPDLWTGQRLVADIDPLP